MSSDAKVISLLDFKKKKGLSSSLPEDMNNQSPERLPEPIIEKVQANAKKKSKERRIKPRVKYHFAKRPTVVVGDVPFRMINVSETGLKYVAQANQIPTVGEKVKGFLFLGSSTTKKITFNASVLRIIGDLVILEFKKPIPGLEFQEELAKVDETEFRI